MVWGGENAITQDFEDVLRILRMEGSIVHEKHRCGRRPTLSKATGARQNEFSVPLPFLVELGNACRSLSWDGVIFAAIGRRNDEGAELATT